MNFLIIVISIIVLLLTRVIYIIIEEIFPKKRKMSEKSIETKMKFKLKKLNVNFGSNLFKQLAEPRDSLHQHLAQMYRNLPKDGVDFQVSYIDTQVQEKPVLVLLHGTPGSVLDFELFCREFGTDFRLIIPQFPDFEFTRKSGLFWHSNAERVELVVDFLRQLDIRRVDCLICHSGGNPVALEMIHSRRIPIGCLVMLTPPGFKWLSRSQLKNTLKLCRIANSRWKRELYRFLVPDWLKVAMGVPKTLLQNCSRDDLYAMTLVAAMSSQDLQAKYESLHSRRLPTLLVWGERDNLFPKWKVQNTLHWIAANRHDIHTLIGAEGETERESEAQEWIRVLKFRFGGHFSHIKYSHVFHKYFLKFFEEKHTKS